MDHEHIRKIALVANVICLWKPTLNKVSCILYLVRMLFEPWFAHPLTESSISPRLYENQPESKGDMEWSYAQNCDIDLELAWLNY